MIKVLKVTVDGNIAVLEIPKTQESYQKAVGGDIQQIYAGIGINLICNEKGYYRHLPYNAKASEICQKIHFNISLYGDVLFAYKIGNEVDSLPDYYINMLIGDVPK